VSPFEFLDGGGCFSLSGEVNLEKYRENIKNEGNDNRPRGTIRGGR
jgi:hypothetical protein